MVGILIAGLLAGCIGSTEDDPSAGGSNEPPEQADEIQTSADKGTVKGQVFGIDNLEALAGARVNLLGSDGSPSAFEATVAKNGDYVINNVEPGKYSVLVFAIGYFQGVRTVDVTAGNVVTVNFQLEPLPSDDPFSTWESYAGFISLALAWQLEGPVGCQVIPMPVGIDVKNCGGIRFGGENGEIGEDQGALNITNDTKTIMVEMVWDPVGPLGERLSLDVLCADVPRGNGGAVLDLNHPCYFQPPTTTSPIVHRIDEEHWIEHGYNYTGWWAARVFGTHGMLGTYDLTKIDVGAAYEQPFTIYVSVFHKEPAPEGHTGIPDA